MSFCGVFPIFVVYFLFFCCDITWRDYYDVILWYIFYFDVILWCSSYFGIAYIDFVSGKNSVLYGILPTESHILLYFLYLHCPQQFVVLYLGAICILATLIGAIFILATLIYGTYIHITHIGFT